MSQPLENKLKKLIVSFLLDSRIPLTHELYLIDFQKWNRSIFEIFIKIDGIN
jgi:hypothetical protein